MHCVSLLYLVPLGTTVKVLILVGIIVLQNETAISLCSQALILILHAPVLKAIWGMNAAFFLVSSVRYLPLDLYDRY